MANETGTSLAGEFVLSEVIAQFVYSAPYAGSKIAPLVRQIDIQSVPANTAEVAKWPTLAAEDLTEAVDMANTPVNPTSTTVASDEAGLMIELTDKLLNSDIHGGPEAYAQQLLLAVGDKRDADLAAEFADFSNSVGTSGANLTETDWLDAITTLETGNAVPDFWAAGHPQQLRDLRVDIVTSSGAVWGTQAPASVVKRMASFYDVPFVQSSNCTTANAGADRLGAMMPMGDHCGISYVLKKRLYVEPQRNASKRSTEFVCVEDYGDECTNTAANGGVKIVTDA